MTNPAGHDDLLDLIDAVCEEAIDSPRMARLEARLLADPAAEDAYARALTQQAELSLRFDSLPPAAPPRRPWRAAWWAALPALAAAALVAAWLARPDGTFAARPVAELVRSADAEWDAAAPAAGAGLPPGRLALRSGLALVRFAGGAEAVVEGPAEMELVTPRLVRCEHGRFRFTVPPAAAGFTADAPAFRVVNQGTEFGASVTPDGRCEVHVLAGRVSVQAAGGADAPAELAAGQALRYDADGSAERVAADPSLFPTAADLDRMAAAGPGERLAAWRAASARLRADPGLRAYYPFDTVPGPEAVLANAAAEYAGDSEAYLFGATGAEGRWPGKGAVAFRGPDDRVAFSVPESLEALSLAAWVRPDALPNRFNGLMMSNGWALGRVHWQVTEPRSLQLCVRDRTPRGGDLSLRPTAANVFGPERVGRWAHAAVVIDRKAEAVTHYLDGQPVKRVSLPLRAKLKVGPAQLGNWLPSLGAGDRVRNFVGRIDEFALFRRPLSDAEVAHLARGDWPRK